MRERGGGGREGWRKRLMKGVFGAPGGAPAGSIVAKLVFSTITKLQSGQNTDEDKKHVSRYSLTAHLAIVPLLPPSLSPYQYPPWVSSLFFSSSGEYSVLSWSLRTFFPPFHTALIPYFALPLMVSPSTLHTPSLCGPLVLDYIAAWSLVEDQLCVCSAWVARQGRGSILTKIPPF